jgi:HrpA-like RNA helicase
MPGLITGFASKDSLRQRMGRSGRTQEGRCFRLIHERVYEGIADHSVPEMLRTPLDRLVLQIAKMVDDGGTFKSGYASSGIEEIVCGLLARCPDPPKIVLML